MYQRFGHLNIRTSKLEETLAFYEILLELRRGPAATMVDQHRNAWLFDAEGRGVIHVNMTESGEAPLHASGVLDHIAFDCEDLDGIRLRLRDLGVSFTEHQTRVAGLSQLVLCDPNGLKIELTFGSDLVRAPPERQPQFD